MRTNLTVTDLGDLVDQPLVAVLATYRQDGNVLLSPVWHEWRNGGFNVVTSHDDIKARHLRRDPRVSLVVFEHVRPYRGIELRTLARFLPAEAPAALRRIAVRYLGEAEGDAYAAGGADDLLIRLEPGELRVWDFADG